MLRQVAPAASDGILSRDDEIDRLLGGRLECTVARHAIGFAQRDGGQAMAVHLPTGFPHAAVAAELVHGTAEKVQAHVDVSLVLSLRCVSPAPRNGNRPKAVEATWPGPAIPGMVAAPAAMRRRLMGETPTAVGILMFAEPPQPASDGILAGQACRRRLPTNIARVAELSRPCNELPIESPSPPSS